MFANVCKDIKVGIIRTAKLTLQVLKATLQYYNSAQGSSVS